MIPESVLLDVICALQAAADRLITPFLMVGAYARDLRLKARIDTATLRATGDIDFAFAVRDWDHYRALRQALLERPEGDFAQAQREKQRLIFHHWLKDQFPPLPAAFSNCELLSREGRLSRENPAFLLLSGFLRRSFSALI